MFCETFLSSIYDGVRGTKYNMTALGNSHFGVPRDPDIYPSKRRLFIETSDAVSRQPATNPLCSSCHRTIYMMIRHRGSWSFDQNVRYPRWSAIVIYNYTPTGVKEVMRRVVPVLIYPDCSYLALQSVQFTSTTPIQQADSDISFKQAIWSRGHGSTPPPWPISCQQQNPPPFQEDCV